MRFYAIDDDIKQIFKYIFEETDLEVYESYSVPDMELRKFLSVNEVMEKISQDIGLSLLSLYSPKFGGKFNIKKINLNSEYCNGATLRYMCEGWGFIHLHFGKVRDERLDKSDTSVNSEKRAYGWYSTCPQFGNPALWNWDLVRSATRKLEYRIKKLSVKKYYNDPVLPSAVGLDKWPMIRKENSGNEI